MPYKELCYSIGLQMYCLFASSGESTSSEADVPPEKTIGGRERNEQETGVLLDMRLDGDD